jgi:hypothetical protein
MRIVTLEDAVLTKLAANPANVMKFSFLRPAVGSRGQGCCSGGQRSRDLSSVKAAVASLPVDRLAEFKGLLGADRLRIFLHAYGRTQDLNL